jgi:hypothetical protein
MRKNNLIFLPLFLATLVNAQENAWYKQLFKRASYDTSYVTSYYNNHLHVTIIGINQALELIVKNNETNKRNIYNPNDGPRIGIGLDYNFLSIEYSKEFSTQKNDINKSLKSQSTSFRFGITGRRILASALVQQIDGMHLDNPNENDPTWNPSNTTKPLRKDIVTTSVLGSLNYFFNHKRYSTMASLWQIDRQKKSAGSFNAGITFSYFRIHSDSAIGPRNQDTNSNYFPIQSNLNYLYGINFGYAYNFIWKKNFFANIFFIPGVNLQFGSENRGQNRTEDYYAKPGIHGDLRLMAGYNGKLYYGGIHYANYFLFSKLKTDTDFDIFNEYFRFFIGRRFDMKKQK